MLIWLILVLLGFGVGNWLSVVLRRGTPGFMPPEEQFGRTLTEASDLYSLGATLICLLTGDAITGCGANLIDDDYRFNFKKLVPKLNPRFISWLRKMVEPNVKAALCQCSGCLASLETNSGAWRCHWVREFS
jgi:serine/threonine protein kinase